MKRPLLLLLLAGCGSTGTGRGGADEAQLSADERAYLLSRREERNCESLRNLADTELANQNHGPALEAAELVIAFCPSSQREAVETTLVLLNRREAVAGGATARSVRVRLALPLPPGDRLVWFAAYADRKLGLNNLTIGPHRVEVELQVWRGHGEEGRLLRVNGGLDLRIDGRMPVWVDAALSTPTGDPSVPPALTLRPASSQMPPGANGPGSIEQLRRLAAFADTAPLPRGPQSLERAGLPASIDLELCFDNTGRIRRVDPLGWPHPRQLGTYVEGLRDWRVPQAAGKMTGWFCGTWRQTLSAHMRASATAQH
jgi:hypothetical protein